MSGRIGKYRAALILSAFLSATVPALEARAQLPLPGLPTAAPANPTAKEKEKEKEGAAGKEPSTKVTATTGPIKVDSHVADADVEHTLETLLPEYPGVHSIDATVNEGVVTLDGEVDTDDTRDQMTAVAQKVEGVRLVINRLSTDAEVETAFQLVRGQVEGIWDMISRRWLLAILAGLIVALFALAARLFNAYADTLLSPFIRNVMLRSVAGSLIGSALVLGGVMMGLSVLNLAKLVLSILGLAGVAGLAVGFAFKDIAENFIASVLLGVRRPFRVGDYITVAGQSGVVRSLNTRATVLVTLEGTHVRIPNNVVYKEILVNATASPTYRANFDVVIPYDASTAAATDAIARALRSVDGVEQDPPARALVEALEPGGVRVRAYYWVPVHNVDWFKLNSDAKLSVKVALQKLGVLGTPPAAPAPKPTANGRSEADQRHDGEGASCAARADNLKRDAHAAATATAVTPEGQPTPVQRALDTSETRVSEEGTNLLAEAK